MIFDKTKDVLIDCFGITVERHKQLIDTYMSGNGDDVLEILCNTELLDNERYMLLIEFGVRMAYQTEQVIEHSPPHEVSINGNDEFGHQSIPQADGN